jgi:hypothetical protein
MIPARCQVKNCGNVTGNISCTEQAYSVYCKDHRCIECDEKKIHNSLYCDLHSCHIIDCSNISITIPSASNLNDICNQILNKNSIHIEYFVESAEFLLINRWLRDTKMIENYQKSILIDMLKDIRKLYLNMIDYHCIECTNKQIKFIVGSTVN